MSAGKAAWGPFPGGGGAGVSLRCFTRAARRAGIAAAGLLAACGSLAGCSSRTDRFRISDALRYPLREQIKSLDPARNEAADTGDLLQNIYEGLVTLDAKTRVAPCLAERWEISADGRTYRFTLRPRARFHAPFDRAVTAEDIRYTLNRIFLPETRSPIMAPALDDILGAKSMLQGESRDLAGVRVVDSRTVEIRLEHPAGYFLSELSGAGIVCREAIERSGGEIDEHSAIGTGPFRLAEFQPGNKVVLEAHGGHWAGRPKLDRIVRPIILDPDTAHIKYENDELDACIAPLSAYVRDHADPALKNQARLVSLGQTTYLAMNGLREPVFRDRRVRQAVAMSIDRDEIMRVAFHGFLNPAVGMLPPGVLGHNRETRPIPYDPGRSRSLLAEAGFPGGRGFPRLSLQFAESSPTMSAAAQVIRNQLLRNLGIQVELLSREAVTFYADSGRGQLPFFVNGWVAVEPHDYLTLVLKTGAKYNMFGYRNPRFDSLCDRGDRALVSNARASSYGEANQLLNDDAALVALAHSRQPWLVKPWVRGLEYNLGGLMPHYHTRIER